MNRFIWMESTDDKVADQLPLIVANLSQAPFATLLNVSPADLERWSDYATWYHWMQKERIPAFRDFSQSLTDVRDESEVAPDNEPIVEPEFVEPPRPASIVGKTIRRDSWDWFNTLVKQWKANPQLTEALQRQLGLVVPVSGAGSDAADLPHIIDIKATSGGEIRIRVFKGGHPQVEVKVVVDGTQTLTEKSMLSTLKMNVGGGVAHALEISYRFLQSDGTPVGDWSPTESASSLK